ncbi:MAG: hypothetical protein WD055_01990 [Candidatus Dependentiae bacterium]
MLNCWGSVSGPCKGILLIITGTILLLHTLGVLTQGMGIIIIIISIAMLGYGFILCGGPQVIQKLLKRKKPE